MAPVKKDEKWGFIDRAGQTIIPMQYDDAWCFDCDDMARVEKDDRVFYINRQGKLIKETV